MRVKKDEIINGLKGLKPFKIINTNTSEKDNWNAFNQDLASLTKFTQSWADQFLLREQELFELGIALSKLSEYPGSPAETARQAGYQIDPDKLPEGVLVKSRVNKLAGSLLIMSYLGWANSEVITKNTPKAGARLMLGAVDKHLASLTMDNTNHVLILTMKAWFNEYELFFHIPKYVQARKVTKWALPTIRPVNKQDYSQGYQFDYAYLEQVKQSTVNNNTNRNKKKHGCNRSNSKHKHKKNKHKQSERLVVGVDLGKRKPYQAVVLNEKGLKVAEYATSGRLNHAWEKYDRIKKNRERLLKKIDHYEALSMPEDKINKLQVEAKRLRSKLTRMRKSLAQQGAAQLISKLEKHEPDLLRLENLSWVTGAQYGSRWNHSAQLVSITHRASRAGLKTVRVNPKNTSQTCSNCGSKLKHDNNKRTVDCSACDKTMDRDVNASVNIALNINDYNPKEFPGRQSNKQVKKTRNTNSSISQEQQENSFLNTRLKGVNCSSRSHENENRFADNDQRSNVSTRDKPIMITQTPGANDQDRLT